MAQTDPADLRFAAARQLVDLLENGDEISVVLFSDGFGVLVPLTKVVDDASKGAVQSQLGPVDPKGNTNFRAGLEAALVELDKGSNAARFAIFLTDGELHPPGWDSLSVSEQEAERNAIFGLASRFQENGWGLFPVSLAGAVDPQFLQGLAETGGGLYRPATEARMLNLVFQEIFAAKKLDVFDILFNDCLAPGEERSVSFPIHQFVSTLSLFVTYPSDIRPVVILSRPDGAAVWPTTTEARYDTYRVDGPVRGTWTVRVKGATEGQSCVSISSTPRALVEVVWLQPLASLSLAAGEPLDLAIQLTARDPQAGQEEPVEDAAVSFTVTGPDGQTYEGTLSHTMGGQYTGQVAFSGLTGRHKVDLTAQTAGGLVARRSFETTISLVPAITPTPTSVPTDTPVAVGTPPPTEAGEGPSLLVVLLGLLAAAVALGLAGSYWAYCRFARPKLRGFLVLEAQGSTYDLAELQRRTWCRRSLTIGGAHDDIDLGLGRRWARVIPRRNGECLLQALARTGINVYDTPLRRGQRWLLFNRCKIDLGGVQLVYWLHPGVWW
jgi:hypothetical protein